MFLIMVCCICIFGCNRCFRYRERSAAGNLDDSSDIDWDDDQARIARMRTIMREIAMQRELHDAV